MTRLLTEPHYLPSLEYFTLLEQADELIWDVASSFQKQTFRNRTYVLTANGVQPLIVPVHYKQQMPFKDVRIDYRQHWTRVHWGAVYSAYGKSPFFDFLAPDFESVWQSKPTFLLDLNLKMLEVCLRVLRWHKPVRLDQTKDECADLRNDILAKKSWELRQFYRPEPYLQNFGNTFVPNLGILDLLFCQGPEAGEILKRSVRASIERFGH